MREKQPFYMIYENQLPMDIFWEREERRDISYMKSLYPAEAKKILPYVEEECERLEYDVSMIYDEYPDRLQVEMMCDRIYTRAAKELGENDWLKELVWVMTCQEICRRRRERRNFTRKYY